MQVQSLDQEDALEEGRTTHSSILAWRIPGTEEPGRLQSIGSQRVRHDWSDLARTHARSGSDPGLNSHMSSTFVCLQWLYPLSISQSSYTVKAPTPRLYSANENAIILLMWVSSIGLETHLHHHKNFQHYICQWKKRKAVEFFKHNFNHYESLMIIKNGFKFFITHLCKKSFLSRVTTNDL